MHAVVSMQLTRARGGDYRMKRPLTVPPAPLTPPTHPPTPFIQEISHLDEVQPPNEPGSAAPPTDEQSGALQPEDDFADAFNPYKRVWDKRAECWRAVAADSVVALCVLHICSQFRAMGNADTR